MDTTSMDTTLADPNQKYWDLGVQYFNKQVPAITAIQNLWSQWLPPASLDALATIIGALYADTYWTTTKFSAENLSSNLQAALGINKPDCDRAAATAFSRWYGLLVRGNMGDSGNQIPRSGNVTQSPDVVVNGGATLTVEYLVRQWNSYLYTPQPGLNNYTYGRAASANIPVPITAPVLRMFYSDAALNPSPTSWIQMFTFDGQATSPLQGYGVAPAPGPIAPGTRTASTDPFQFSPPGSGHYCLISVAGTEYFTNNPLTQTGNWSSQEWINGNGAAGWHNVDVARSNAAVLKFYNQDSVPERFVFEAHGRNLPPGTLISLECTDPALRTMLAVRSDKATKAYEQISTEAVVPPNYAGDLAVRFDVPGGKPLPPDASVEVRMYWVLPQGHPHYSAAAALPGDTASALLGRPIRVPMGSFTFVGG